MRHIISIYSSNDRINPVFVKANSFLLKKFRSSLQSNNNSKDLIKKLWKEEFNITINDQFTELEFTSQHKKSLFELRFT